MEIMVKLTIKQVELGLDVLRRVPMAMADPRWNDLVGFVTSLNQARKVPAEIKQEVLPETAPKKE